jgi:DNA mismatch endonuclease, patch repair protein
MADRIPKDARSRNMQKIRSRDTKPEMVVRRLVHNMGFRYRLHGKDLPGMPDLVFRPKKKIVLVHGCFWHQHPSSICKLLHKPKSNNSYWDAKLSRNVERDASNLRLLEAQGWSVLTVWECETKNVEQLKSRLSSFLEK